MKRLLLFTFLPLVAINQAQASSEQAWKDQERDQRERCLAASQLQQARIAGDPVLFDDSLGVTAVMISGRYPQAHMKGQRGRELCLYERRTGKVHISEADKLVKGAAGLR